MNTIVVPRGRGTRFGRKRKKIPMQELAIEIERLPQIEELAQNNKVSRYNEGFDDNCPITFLGDLLDLEVRISKDNQIDQEAESLKMGDTPETDMTTDLTYVIKVEPKTPPRSLSHDGSPPSTSKMPCLLGSLYTTNISSKNLATQEEFSTVYQTPTTVVSQSVATPMKNNTIFQSVATPMKNHTIFQSVATPMKNNTISQSVATPMKNNTISQSVATPMKNNTISQSVATPMKNNTISQSVATPMKNNTISQSVATTMKNNTISQSVATTMKNNTISQSVATPMKNNTISQSVATLMKNNIISQSVATSTFEKMNTISQSITCEKIYPFLKVVSESIADPEEIRSTTEKKNIFHLENTCNINVSQPLISKSGMVENLDILSLKEVPKKLNEDPHLEAASINLNITFQPQASITNLNDCLAAEPTTEITSKSLDNECEIDLTSEDGAIPSSSSSTTVGNLPALPSLTNAKSKLKKSQPVATVKPMPTNKPSSKDDSDNDITILEEIIDVEVYQPKTYAEAFVTPEGTIVDQNNIVIGHLDREWTSGISLSGETLLTLPKAAIKFVPNSNSCKRKNTVSNLYQSNNIIVSKEGSSKKIIKKSKEGLNKKNVLSKEGPSENNTLPSQDDDRSIGDAAAATNSTDNNKDSSELKPKKKSSRKRKPQNTFLEKRDLPARTKKAKEEGFYKRFTEDMEEDILNVSDCDDPSYVPEEVDTAHFSPVDDSSNSNECYEMYSKPNETNLVNEKFNGIYFSKLNESSSIDQEPKPSSNYEIMLKEGDPNIKESESKANKKKKNRAMPLSVRLKKEEKRRRMEILLKSALLPEKANESTELPVAKVGVADTTTPSLRVEQELIDDENEATISPISLKKELLNDDSIEKVENYINSTTIQSQLITAPEATPSVKSLPSSSSIIQLGGQSYSPNKVENPDIHGPINSAASGKGIPQISQEIVQEEPSCSTSTVDSIEQVENSTTIQSQLITAPVATPSVKSLPSSSAIIQLGGQSYSPNKVENPDIHGPINSAASGKGKGIPQISQEIAQEEPSCSTSTDDPIEQVENSTTIQSQLITAPEATPSVKSHPSTRAIIQLEGQSYSPINVENPDITIHGPINSAASGKGIPQISQEIAPSCSTSNICDTYHIQCKDTSDFQVKELTEEKTDCTLMISNIKSLSSFIDEDYLVGFSQTMDTTYSTVKVIRSDLMKHLIRYQSIFKFSTRDNLKIFQLVDKVFPKPN